MIFWLLPMAAWAQASAFEAATVKPVKAGTRVAGLRGGPGTASPGQLTGAETLKALLVRAYELKDYQVVGPAWIESERYEVTAKIPDGAAEAQVAPMLRALLEERFRLRAHRERREMPIYALVVARGGPKLKESRGAAGETEIVSPKFVAGANGLPEFAPGTDAPRSFEIVLAGSDGILYKRWARRETMQQLADRLTADLARAVVDRTGLNGRHDFTLTWAREGGGSLPRTGPPPDQIESVARPVLGDGAVSIFAAVRAQLGLRLEPGKAPIEVLVVDAVERVPSM